VVEQEENETETQKREEIQRTKNVRRSNKSSWLGARRVRDGERSVGSYGELHLLVKRRHTRLGIMFIGSAGCKSQAVHVS
jgi:hypothetical protein